MLVHFGATAAPVFPIACPVLPPATPEEIRAGDLAALDDLIDAYAAALEQRDTAARQLAVLELRIVAVRAALAGQLTLDPTTTAR